MRRSPSVAPQPCFSPQVSPSLSSYHKLHIFAPTAGSKDHILGGHFGPFFIWLWSLFFGPFFFQRRLYLMMKCSISIANVHWSVPLRLVLTLPHWLKTAVFFFFSPSLQPLILFEGLLKLLAVLIVAFAAACCFMSLLSGLQHCLVFFPYLLYYHGPTRWIVIRLFFPQRFWSLP